MRAMSFQPDDLGVLRAGVPLGECIACNVLSRSSGAAEQQVERFVGKTGGIEAGCAHARGALLLAHAENRASIAHRDARVPRRTSKADRQTCCAHWLV